MNVAALEQAIEMAIRTHSDGGGSPDELPKNPQDYRLWDGHGETGFSILTTLAALVRVPANTDLAGIMTLAALNDGTEVSTSEASELRSALIDAITGEVDELIEDTLDGAEESLWDRYDLMEAWHDDWPTGEVDELLDIAADRARRNGAVTGEALTRDTANDANEKFFTTFSELAYKTDVLGYRTSTPYSDNALEELVTRYELLLFDAPVKRPPQWSKHPGTWIDNRWIENTEGK